MQKLKTRLSACLILTLTGAWLAGCANKPNACLWVEPIRPAKADLVCMTRGTKQQIVTHNETWERQQ